MRLPLLLVLALPLDGCAGPGPHEDPIYDLASLESALEPDGRRRFRAAGEPVTGRAEASEPGGFLLTTRLVDGYEHGVQRLRFASGTLARVVPMRHGREHGRVEMWRADGRPYVLEHEFDGEALGPQLRWNERGELERFEVLLEDRTAPPGTESIEEWIASGRVDGATAELWRAVALAREGRLEEALGAFERALEAGHATPSDGVSLLPALRAHPGLRVALAARMHEHARESTVRMAPPREPGTPLRVDVRLVDAVTGAPVVDGRVRLSHVDADGFYWRDEPGTFAPRLTGSGRSGLDGRVTFHTIRPAHYHESLDPGGEHPAHVHVDVDAEGYRDTGGEVVFADDPRLPFVAVSGHVAAPRDGGAVPVVEVELALIRAR